MLWAGILNFNFKIVFWNIFFEIWRSKKRITLSEKKSPLVNAYQKLFVFCNPEICSVSNYSTTAKFAVVQCSIVQSLIAYLQICVVIRHGTYIRIALYLFNKNTIAQAIIFLLKRFAVLKVFHFLKISENPYFVKDQRGCFRS